MLRPFARRSLLFRAQRRTLIRDVSHTKKGVQGGRQPEWMLLDKGGIRITQQPSSQRALEILRRLKEENTHPSAIIRDLDFDADLPSDVLPLLLSEVEARLNVTPRQERRKAMQDQPMAAYLLRGIWSHENIWRNLSKVFSAQDMLCNQAIAEGLDHYILDWVTATVPRKQASTRAELWRAPLLRSLVDAQVSLAPPRSADAALRVFLSFHDRREEAKRRLQRPLAHDQRRALLRLVDVSPAPAYIGLRKRLFGGGFSDTSGKLWDAFMRTIDTDNKFTEWSNAFDRVSLELTHPIRTNTSAALQFLDKFYPESDLEKMKECLPSSPELRTSLQKLFLFSYA